MSKPMKINFKNELLSVQGINESGNTMVDLRDFAEALGHKVNWVPHRPDEIFIDCVPPPATGSPVTYLPLAGKQFIIGAGHGYDDVTKKGDPGAVDPVNPAEGDKINTIEAHINFLYAVKLASALKALGAEVTLTRKANEFLPPNGQAAFAKKYPNATAYITWHNNAGPAAAKGFEVLFYRTGGEGWKLASAILKEVKATGIPIHGPGLWERPKLAVIGGTPMTSIIIEGGFITNPQEEVNLHDQGYMERLILAAVRGVVAVYGKVDRPADIEYRKFRHLGTDIHVTITRKPNLKVVSAPPGANAYNLLNVATAAEKNKARLAINGGYFWEREKDNTFWPVTPVIADHKSVGKVEAQKAPRAALCQKDDGTMEIKRALKAADLTGYKNAMGAGPILVMDGKVKVGYDELWEDNIVNGPNPRTAVGLIDPNTLVQVVVEGRSLTDAGLTLKDLADFFVGLGCRQAMNFDGGGSCSFWLNGKSLVKGRAVTNALLTL